MAGHLDDVDGTVAATDLHESEVWSSAMIYSAPNWGHALTTIFSWSISRLIGPLSLVASSGRLAQAPPSAEG